MWLTGLAIAWGIALGTDIAAPAKFACDILPAEYHNHRADSRLRTERAGVAARCGVGYEYYFTLLEHRKVWNSVAREGEATRVAEITSEWALAKVAPWRVEADWPYGTKRSMQGLLAVGWPRRSLYSVYTSHRATGTLHPFVGGIELPGTQFAGILLTRTLPYTPIWSGLLFNATLYSALLWGARLAATQTLRFRRRRLRRCAKCDYDLSATPATSPCSECGTTQAHAISLPYAPSDHITDTSDDNLAVRDKRPPLLPQRSSQRTALQFPIVVARKVRRYTRPSL